jgi:hypothetical protein
LQKFIELVSENASHDEVEPERHFESGERTVAFPVGPNSHTPEQNAQGDELCTASLGNFIKPDSKWSNTDKSSKFVVPGLSDSEYVPIPIPKETLAAVQYFFVER